MNEHISMTVTVEAHYSWDGKLRGYKRAVGDTVMFIPIDSQNTDYQRLLAEIDSGAVSVVMQRPTSAYPTYSKNGKQSGFDTDIGFIPCHEANPRYVELLSALADKTCEVRERDVLLEEEGGRVTELIVCVFFSQAWPHVVDVYEGELSVRANANTVPQPFKFLIRNLRGQGTQNLVELFLAAHGCEGGAITPNSPGISGSTLEIAIPVSALRKICRGAEADRENSSWAFLSDLLAVERTRSGRSSSEGPSTPWLIDNAPNYMTSFVCDFANRIVEAFWIEYGGSPMAYVTQFTQQRQSGILWRMESGKTTLGSMRASTSDDFALSGTWCGQVGLDAVSDAPQYVHYPIQRALSRLRMLLRMGFLMEGAILANSVLEVSVAGTLQACSVGDVDLQAQVRGLGHRRRLELLEGLNRLCGTSDSDEMAKYLDVAKELYAHRNNYVHDLAFPESSNTLRHHHQQQLHRIMEHLSDPHLLNRWAILLDSIPRGDAKLRDFLRNECAECAKVPAQAELAKSRIHENLLWSECRRLGRVFKSLFQ